MTILPKIAIIYDSMGRTKLMAEAMAEGAKSIPGVKILLKEISYAVPEDIRDADAIFLGGSTHDDKALVESLNSFLMELEKMNMEGRIGVAFGSCAGGDQSHPDVTRKMASSGMRVIRRCEGEVPEDNIMKEFFMLGRSVAQEFRRSITSS